MRFTGLVLHELTRLWSRRRLLLVLVAMTAVGAASIVGDSTGLVSTAAGTMSITAPMLFFGALDQIAFFFVFWPIAVGGTTAEDVSGGFMSLLVTRAGSRSAWISSKLVATILTSLLSFALIAAVWLVVARFVSPWDIRGLSGTVGFGGSAVSEHPVLFTGFVVAVLSVAGAAVAMLSALIGVVTASPLMSQVGTSIVYLAVMFALPQQINPMSRASMVTFQAPWMTPVSCATYWVTTLTLFSILTYAAALRREAR